MTPPTTKERKRKAIQAKRPRKRIADLKWTKEDDFLQDHILKYEMTARQRAHRYFDCAPEALLPDDVYIDTSSNGEKTYLRTQITNTNWSESFAKEFSLLLCCSPLHNHPKLIKFAIQLAMWYRLEERHIAEPDEDLIEGIPHKLFVEYIKEAIGDQMKARGNTAPRGIARGVLARDLEAVTAAWDLYITDEDEDIVAARKDSGRTRSMAQYLDKSAKEKAREVKPSQAKRERKKWILRHRKMEKLEQEAEEEIETESESDPNPEASDKNDDGPTPGGIPHKDTWPTTKLDKPKKTGVSDLYREHQMYTSGVATLKLTSRKDWNGPAGQLNYVSGAPPIERDFHLDEWLLESRYDKAWLEGKKTTGGKVNEH